MGKGGGRVSAKGFQNVWERDQNPLTLPIRGYKPIIMGFERIQFSFKAAPYVSGMG